MARNALALALPVLLCVACDRQPPAAPAVARPAASRKPPAKPARAARRGPARLFVVSSYHREYLWSQETQAGVCRALVELGYLTAEQAEQFTRTDRLQAPRVVLQKAWMDTKRRNARREIEATIKRIIAQIDAFKPDLLLLGDDNAANYLGNAYLDTRLPVVFWGVNASPRRYGLVESIERPGHNVTGVYQRGYPRECLELLARLVPRARRFAILSDDSPTGRSKAKVIEHLAQAGKLPLELAGTVATNSFDATSSRRRSAAARCSPPSRSAWPAAWPGSSRAASPARSWR